MIQKVISGAQTGADRAGIDTAIELDVYYGDWLKHVRYKDIWRDAEKIVQSTPELAVYL